MNKKSSECNFGDNQVICHWEKYAVVFNYENDKFYYFECPEIEGLIGTCVEVELLHPIEEIMTPELNSILQMGVKEK